MKESIKILEAHNAWRRGAETKQESPYIIGMAIDECVQAAKRYELLRTLNIQQFGDLFRRNLQGENFDSMIDELIKARAR